MQVAVHEPTSATRIASQTLCTISLEDVWQAPRHNSPAWRSGSGFREYNSVE
ncbi:hypothetical protein M404DRAFT_999002 [Pisolithus tinctorius Marx 270]|uniref:Uncharacterized protein n=1 Tax=Pisolithus tinctorius Marx 270 TaxID=870435 RepID=A0A0C3NZV1_PISTI|nr:hypothetical protein M404DRAFT_999002 [Pisolithus tinctorius Marx 270]